MSDEEFMGLCLELAREAGERGEVPIGAVVVRGGAVVGEGANRPIGDCDPTAHAEVVALRAAAAAIGNYRLVDTQLFVTVEPCLMCVGALLQARVERVVYGCHDPKGGFLGSLEDFSADARLNHGFDFRPGVRAAEAADLMSGFFRSRRRR